MNSSHTNGVHFYTKWYKHFFLIHMSCKLNDINDIIRSDEVGE